MTAPAMTAPAMTAAEPIWVGMLDLDSDRPVTGISGPMRAVQSQARVLVRLHGAPLGFVQVPAWPADTLTARVRTEAGTTLAAALRRHAERDGSAAASTGAGMTVAICTRNRAGLLRTCLHAVRQISYDPVEILVVDNAPSDESTRQLVTELAAADPRVRYAREPRPGLSS